MRDNVIKTKSYDFALRVVKLYKHLISEQKEYVLSKQLLRSGTSVGANIEEGLSGQSKKDFIAKLFISLKEAKESHYWIRLLRDSDYLDKELAESFLKDVDELISILTAIIKSTKNNLGVKN